MSTNLNVLNAIARSTSWISFLIIFIGDHSNAGEIPDTFAIRTATAQRSQAHTAVETDRSKSKNEFQLLSDLGPLVKEVYVWAWPMVYMHNVQKSLSLIRKPGVSGGAPVAPINSLCMLTDVVSAEFNSVPCPNRDVIYGFGIMDLSRSPVVVQVPEFPEPQFWLYQLGDHRTDSFAEMGSMYQTRAGFYLIVGPEWSGQAPEGIERVFRSPTNLAYILPRVLVSPVNKQDATLKPLLAQIAMYPLSKYTGRLKTCDWTKRKWYPAIGEMSREHCKLVRPATFFEDLRAVLNAVSPLDGEEHLYQEARRLVEQYEADPNLATALKRAAVEMEKSEIVPFFQFQNVGDQLPGFWTSVANGAAYGVDYRTRTAVAKSNIFVNRAHEAKYFYLERSSDGLPLSGANNYKVTFAANALPPNHGFWSLTLYDADHRLVANPWQIHSITSVDKSSLKWSEDGSLTVEIGTSPNKSDKTNWLPAPSGHFVLYLRVYVPQKSILDGQWSPPAAIPIHEWGTGLPPTLASASTPSGK